MELLDTCFANVPPDLREIRVRADAGFGFDPVLEALESRPTQYAVVARLTQPFRRLLPGLSYESVNRDWEMVSFEHRPHAWRQARRFVVARRFILDEEPPTTLFPLGRYLYRAWVTNLALTPLRASGISMTIGPRWNLASPRCGRTTPCVKSPPAPFRPMPSS